MGYSRRIDSRIQNDEKYRSMSWDGKNLWFHCFSHPQLTTFGAVRASIPGLIAEFKIPEKSFTKWFQENLDRRLILYDPEMLLWFPNYLKHNPPASANVLKSWPKVLDTLPDCPLKITIISSLIRYIENSKYKEPEILQQLVDLRLDLKEDHTEEHGLDHALDPLSVYTYNSIYNPNKEEKKSPSKENGLYRFDEFTSLYPRLEEIGRAEREWKKLKRPIIDRIIEVLPHYKFNEDPQYIPFPGKWIKEKRWEDRQITRNPDLPKGAVIHMEECSTCHDVTYTKSRDRVCPDCKRVI